MQRPHAYRGRAPIIHNRAFVWLGGVPATVRIDNLKTGVAEGSGAWTVVLHPGYASGAKQFVERRGHDVKHMLTWEGERFATFAALQRATEQRAMR